MRTHNLSDEQKYPNVHFYSVSRTVNIFTENRIAEGHILQVDGKELEVLKVSRDTVCNTLAHKYTPSTTYHVVKYKIVA